MSTTAAVTKAPRPALAAGARGPAALLVRTLDHAAALGARPVDASSAAVFRIVFGLVGLIAVVRFFAYGWIDQLYLDAAHHFTYVGFGWVQPLPDAVMYAHFVLLGALSLAITAGYHYRLAAALFFVGFTYVELIDKTTYLNHYYLISLASLLMIFLPLDRAWSVDAWRRARRGAARPAAIPVRVIWLLRAQLAAIYLFAGSAKLNPDWLLEAQPLRIWLHNRADMPLLGPLFAEPATAYLMSYAGALFDLTIVAWLLWGRSRPFAFPLVIAFHAATWLLFDIGVFPWLMIGATLIFFAPGWPRRLLARIRPGPLAQQGAVEGRRVAQAALPPRGGSWPARLAALGLAAFILAQVAVPLRHFAYAGNVRWNEEGYRFSWRVLLTEKTGFVQYRVHDPASGRRWLVDPDSYLTPLQLERFATQPDMILAVAHWIADDFAARRIPGVEVRADAFVAWNGRAPRRLVDPEVDLAREPQGLAAKAWVLRFPKTAP